MKTLAKLTALLCLTLGLSAPAQIAQAYDQPNIVILMTDDQRWDSLNKGYTHDFMPTIKDELIAHGIKFKNAMVPTSTCCPSRAATLTGLYAHTNGVYTTGNKTYGHLDGFVAHGNESRTIAKYLHDDGYTTGLVGKYLNGYEDLAENALYKPQGWDQWTSFANSINYFNYSLYDGANDTVTDYQSAASDYSTDVLGDAATDFVTNADPDAPLFLYFTPYGPHKPYTPPPRYAGDANGLSTFRPGSYNEANVSDKPSWVSGKGLLSQSERDDLDADFKDQYETLHAVDDAFANILGALDATDRLDNTLIIYMSDNGLMFGEHRLVAKNNPYDAATRIPMVVRWDAGLSAGQKGSIVDDRIVLNVDVAKTISDATGINFTTTPLEGQDLLTGTRTGFPLESWKNENTRPQYCAWRTLTGLYVRYSNDSGQGAEFYDYTADPDELVNKVNAAAYASTVTAYRQAAKDACSPVPPGFTWS